MKNFAISIPLIFLLVGCKVSSDNVVLKPVKNSNYFFVQNSELYCIFGDKNDRNPTAGTIYSEQKIESVDFPESFEVVDFEFAKDEKNKYRYYSICTETVPGECECGVEKI